MPDHDQIIDQIRAFVQSADQTRTPALEALAVAYAEACGEVGRRLSRCHGLLRQGLRSEAIQLAETAPRLLDQLAALDFPERTAWDEIVQVYDLLPAPPIPVETASFLNEAYAEEDPLRDLLRSHRRLALARAPLAERIEALRRLAAHDPNNPIWLEDLRTFEAARLVQVERESAEAEKTGDAEAITRLLSELEDQTWAEPPPERLLAPLRALNARLQKKWRRAKLAEIEGRLSDAFAADDPIRGRIARDQWLERTASFGLRDDDPMRDRVEPALRWLDAHDRQADADRRRETAFEALNARLDDPAPAPSRELERLAGELGGFRENFPGDLVDRFHARLAMERARESRRRNWILAGASAAALVVAIAIGTAYRNHARSTRAARAAVAVTDMLELGEVDRALEFLNAMSKADAAVVESPEFHEARSLLTIEREKEVARVLEFDRLIRLADQAPAIEENPDALESARKLARLATEKTAIEERANSRRVTAQAERERREEALGPRLQELDERANALVNDFRRGGDSGDPNRFLEPLVKLQDECRGFEAEAQAVGGGSLALLQSITAKLNNFGAEFDRGRRLTTAEDQLVIRTTYAPDARFDPDGYADALDAYARALGDSARVEEVERVRGEARTWKAIVAWGRMVDRWKKDGTDLTPKQAVERLDECSKFINDHSWFPWMESAERCRARLQAVAARSAGDPKSPVGRLRALLSDQIIDAVWLAQVRREGGGGRDSYYLRRKPDEGSNLLQYIENFDGRVRDKPIVLQFITHSDWSPQTKLASKYKPMISGDLTESQWDETMLAMLADVRDDPLMDPLLKMILLKKIGEDASAGGASPRKALEATLAALGASDVDPNVPWMDPTNTTANRLRPRAQALIDGLPDLAAAARAVEEERRIADRIATASPRAVGWLAPRDGSWTLHAGKSLPRDGELWTAAPDGATRSTGKRLGTLQNGIPKLDPEDDDALAEGRPVFVWLE